MIARFYADAWCFHSKTNLMSANQNGGPPAAGRHFRVSMTHTPGSQSEQTIATELCSCTPALFPDWQMSGEQKPRRSKAAEAFLCRATAALHIEKNLNEYVAALIALKQKIIDTDHLLTDYEQKCNELKSAERENHTLRQQVEQMLQKLSPLEKCQEELGSVQAELEEKKSSLKIYQDTHQEYFRVKEEMGKSDAMKKKLEAKVKKLEKATEKHNQDFRQLKAEKKVLEKELKKAQGKTEGFPKEKQKKVVRHVETQSERGWPVATLDKGEYASVSLPSCRVAPKTVVFCLAVFTGNTSCLSPHLWKTELLLAQEPLGGQH
ncbi:little elongation complex subunit 1-like [Sphaerodactylus townsendi]|uniref:little elongation complex subunit 1-like n=1 Tax=Sphaerodactylus townsendi TaxID=933632 RepID=UPI002026CC65|nr:little elongation complex subunit 1-like [Sphaerodactylus townsendi]